MPYRDYCGPPLLGLRVFVDNTRDPVELKYESEFKRLLQVFKRLCRLRGLSKWPYVKQLSAKPNSSPQVFAFV